MLISKSDIANFAVVPGFVIATWVSFNCPLRDDEIVSVDLSFSRFEISNIIEDQRI